MFEELRNAYPTISMFSFADSNNIFITNFHESMHKFVMSSIEELKILPLEVGLSIF